MKMTATSRIGQIQWSRWIDREATLRRGRDLQLEGPGLENCSSILVMNRMVIDGHSVWFGSPNADDDKVLRCLLG